MRMLKSLAELPGDRGLEAVDRFSSSSLETVRSKTGFMVCVQGSGYSRVHVQVPGGGGGETSGSQEKFSLMAHACRMYAGVSRAFKL